jgi:pantoate--beta-alanine ligase
VIDIASVVEMRAWSRAQRSAGRRVGFVPTMGYLHEGHLRLLDRARALSDATVVSIFVNPLQFGPSEDLDRYPRDLPRDRSLARDRGADCLFVPPVTEMYAEPALVRVTPGPLADHLCGVRRPGHFEGVLTVVAKLFHIVEPDVAVFGRKDAQQARVILRMVSDLNGPVEIAVAPTTREPDGLAMSSRNAYLQPADRERAAQIPAALRAAHAAFVEGETSAQAICDGVRAPLAADPGIDVEYVEAVDPDTLSPVATVDDRTLLAVAARVGSTRLIDNIVMGEGFELDTFLAP